MGREIDAEAQTWTGAVPTIAECVTCDTVLRQKFVGIDDPVRSAGWLPCYDHKWQCPTCFTGGGWTRVTTGGSVRVAWVPTDDIAAVRRLPLPSPWFVVEGNALTGGEGFWLSNGLDSVQIDGDCWIVMTGNKVRLEPFEWLGTEMIAGGVMADEPF